jgi:hypothetical protein
MKHPGSLSIMLHAVRLFGPKVDFAQPGSDRRVKALDIALDVREGRAFFGPTPCLIETRSGIRSLVTPRSRADRARSPERQAHVDQLLAALAEAGVSTDHPIATDTRGGTVRSILDDSLANFDLKQEIEWTALAFALYLPPQRGWSDRFGRRYTFDDLVAEMMTRPLDREGISCEGTHLLYSLAVILRVDRAVPVLSPSSRLALREHLAETVSRALASQGPDGGWQPGWHHPPRRQPDDGSRTDQSGPGRILVTGHHLEWLLLLPDDLRPTDDGLRRAALWLREELSRATDQAIAEDYCPYSHAVRVLTKRPVLD